MFDVILGYRFQHDDNVPISPANNALVSDKADFRHVLSADVLANYSIGYGFDWLGEAHLSQGFHHNLDQYDFSEQNYVMSLGWGQGQFGWRLPIEYTLSHQDGEQTLASFSVSLGTYLLTGPMMSLYGYARLEDNDFSNQNRDNDADVLGLYLRWGTSDKPMRFRTIVEVGQEDAKANHWDRDTLRLHVYGDYHIGPRLEAGLGFEYRNYQHDNDSNGSGVKRRDTINMLFANVSYELKEDLDLQLRASYEDSDSNVNFYQYNRSVVSADVTWRY